MSHRPEVWGWRGFSRAFSANLLLLVPLLLIMHPLEHSEFGDQVRRGAYNIIQKKLTKRSATPETVVVDISDVPLVPDSSIDSPNPPLVTSRTQLLKLLKVIDSLQPRSIALDINFDRGLRHFSPDEHSFLKGISRLRNHDRVVLGIMDYAQVPAKDRLFGAFPNTAYIGAYLEDNTRIVSRYKDCPSLSLAAAHPPALKDSQPTVPRFLTWLVQTERKVEDAPAYDYLIDYSFIDSIESSTIKPRQLTEGRIAPELRSRLMGKVVFLGKVTKPAPSDLFVVPNHNVPKAGVLVHATATETLLHAPLFKFTEVGRFVMDVLFAVLIVGTPFLLHRFRRVDDRQRVSMQTRIVVAVVGLLGCFTFVAYTRVLWDDYPFVVLASFLDQPLEEKIHGAFEFLKRNVLRRFAGRSV